MITSILINALGQAIFESFGQALLIYIGLQLFFQLFPRIGSNYRYDINYLGLTIITCWFLANLAKIYLHDIAMPHYALTASVANMTNVNKQLPTLLQQAEGYIIQYAKYITGLYMIGLMLHSFKLMGGLMNIQYIRNQKNLSEDSPWSTKVASLVKNLGISKKVSLYFSAHVQIPLTIGHFKPIVIFPLALINNLETEQVEAILLHELAHIKRNDYLFNIIQCIMETILCFNPFVWLISKTIREEREYCCDDMVVDADYNNFTYSKALFIIAQQNTQKYALAMASARSNKYPLLNRIKRLNTMNTNDSLPKFHLLIVVAIAAIGALLAWGIPQYSIAKTTATHKKVQAATYPLDKFALAAPVKAPVISTIIIHNRKKPLSFTIDTVTNTQLGDTVKHTQKFSIVIDDGKGNKKEYHSIDEMPVETRHQFLKENKELGEVGFMMDSAKMASIKQLTNSPEWKKQMQEIKIQSEKMRKQFDSPAWKKQVMAMQIQAKKMNSQYMNSPQWKKQVAEMQMQGDKMKAQFDSPEWKQQMKDIQLKVKEQMDNPEFKKQMEDMQIKIKEQFNNPEFKKQVADMKKQAEIMSKQANSPQWKKQVKEMQKQGMEMAKKFNSPEWKKQMEDMQIKIKAEVDEQTKKADEADTVNVVH
jgi:bla regulator protein BlaR1